jgi:hypothetical protein
MQSNYLIKVFLAVFILIFIAFTLQSCGTIKREAILLDGKVTSPINCPPVFLTGEPNAGHFVISPHIEANTAGALNGSVGASGFTSSTNNLSWEISGMSGGLNLELPLSNSFSFTGSINLTRNNNPRGSAGLAIVSKGENIGFRLDGGLLFNRFSYDAHSAVVETITPLFGSSRTNTYYYHDIGNCGSNNFYISVTLNSVNKDRFVNYFVNLGYFGQTILDYNPGNFDEGYYVLIPFPISVINNTNLSYTAQFFNIYPGLYFNLSDNARILAGSRILLETEMHSKSGSVLFSPSIQFEYSL